MISLFIVQFSSHSSSFSKPNQWPPHRHRSPWVLAYHRALQDSPFWPLLSAGLPKMQLPRPDHDDITLDVITLDVITLDVITTPVLPLSAHHLPPKSLLLAHSVDRCSKWTVIEAIHKTVLRYKGSHGGSRWTRWTKQTLTGSGMAHTRTHTHTHKHTPNAYRCTLFKWFSYQGC